MTVGELIRVLQEENMHGAVLIQTGPSFSETTEACGMVSEGGDPSVIILGPPEHKWNSFATARIALLEEAIQRVEQRLDACVVTMAPIDWIDAMTWRDVLRRAIMLDTKPGGAR